MGACIIHVDFVMSTILSEEFCPRRKVRAHDLSFRNGTRADGADRSRRTAIKPFNWEGAADIVRAMSKILDRMQSLGMLRTNLLNPMVQVLSTLFAVHGYLGMFPLNRLFLPAEDFSSPEAQARTKEYIVDFVAHGLLADPVESKS